MGGWKHGILDVCDNPLMFIWTFVPCGCCCMQVLNAKKAGNKEGALIACLCVWFLGCIGTSFNRYQLRQKLGVDDSIVIDVLLSWFCCCLSVSQEWKEAQGTKKTICDVLK